VIAVASRWCAVALLCTIAAIVTFDNIGPDRVSDVGEPSVTDAEIAIAAAAVAAPVVVVVLTMPDILARSRSKWTVLLALALLQGSLWVWWFAPPVGWG